MEKNDGVQAQCSTCRFVIKGETNPQTLQRQMFCHRFPPIPSSILVNPVAGQVMNLTNWPSVTHDMWCGEFRFKDASQAGDALLPGEAMIPGRG